MNKNLIVKFGKEYVFEDKKYLQVDLSGIEDFTADDLNEIDSQWKIASGSGIAALQEFDLLWTCFAAAKAAKLPVEFFRKLPGRDAIKIRDVVTGYFRK